MMAVFEPKFSMKLDKAAAAPAADALFETKLHFMFENQSEKEKLFGKVFFSSFPCTTITLNATLICDIENSSAIRVNRLY